MMIKLIVFSSKYRQRPFLSNVQVGSEYIEQNNIVSNLGVLFDQTLSFGEHVSKLCKSSCYYLRGGEWSFKNSGSRKLFVEFHGSRSLVSLAVLCVSQFRFFIRRSGKVSRSLDFLQG